MSKRDKRLEAARHNPKDVTHGGLCNLLSSFGAVIETNRGKGSHVVARFPGMNKSLPIPKKNPMRPKYVKLAIEMIEEYLYLQEEG